VGKRSNVALCSWVSVFLGSEHLVASLANKVLQMVEQVLESNTFNTIKQVDVKIEFAQNVWQASTSVQSLPKIYLQ